MACSGAAPQAGTGWVTAPKFGWKRQVRRDGIRHHRGVQIDLDALPADPAILQQMLREVVTVAAHPHGALHAENDKLRLLIQAHQGASLRRQAMSLLHHHLGHDRRFDEQRGGEIARFVDINSGGPQPVVMPAADHLTRLNRRGAASMGRSARRLPPGIPVFVAIGTRDSEGLNTGARRVFAVLPRDPRHRFIEVDGNHDGVPLAASGVAQAWGLEVAMGSAGH